MIAVQIKFDEETGGVVVAASAPIPKHLVNWILDLAKAEILKPKKVILPGAMPPANGEYR